MSVFARAVKPCIHLFVRLCRIHRTLNANLFYFCVHSQAFQVRIIDDEEYEKHENFFIVLEEPRWLKRGISGTLFYVD